MMPHIIFLRKRGKYSLMHGLKDFFHHCNRFFFRELRPRGKKGPFLAGCAFFAEIFCALTARPWKGISGNAARNVFCEPVKNDGQTHTVVSRKGKMWRWRIIVL